MGTAWLRARCPGLRALRRDRRHHPPCRWHHCCSHVPSSSSRDADFLEPCQALGESGAHPGSQPCADGMCQPGILPRGLECCPGAWLPLSAPSSHSHMCQAALIPPKIRQRMSPAQSKFGSEGCKASCGICTAASQHWDGTRPSGWLPAAFSPEL